MTALIEALAGDEAAAALLSDAAGIAAMVRFEAALAEAEAEAGLIPAAAGPAIAEALSGFRPDMAALAQGIARDGVVVPALVKALRAAAGPHGDAVHFGATSQDAIDTATVMQAAAVAGLLAERGAGILSGLDAMAARWGGQALMAHTRMQRALPFTVAAKVESWRAPLARVLAGLAAAGEAAFVVQLGGPVGDGASFRGRQAEVAAGVARRLGLRPAPPWQAGRDRLAAFAGELAALSGVLGKFGADVALMAQNELGEVRIAGGGSSSAMAHKANPVNAEVLVSLARFNAGLSGTFAQALVHENERSGAGWTLEWLVLPRMLVTAAASTRLARALVGQMSF